MFRHCQRAIFDCTTHISYLEKVILVIARDTATHCVQCHTLLLTNIALNVVWSLVWVHTNPLLKKVSYFDGLVVRGNLIQLAQVSVHCVRAKSDLVF